MTLRQFLVATIFAGASLGAWAQDKVVYHIDDMAFRP